MQALPDPSDHHRGRCDLCGCEVDIVNAVTDDLGTFSICAGCAELWTTHLMHHPNRMRRRSPQPDDVQPPTRPT